MRLRQVLDELRRRGGKATVAELVPIDANASRTLHKLHSQGYVEKVADGWQLTAFGRGTSIVAEPLHKSRPPADDGVHA